MQEHIKRPNIFAISSKELSQDAFLTWLLQWSDPKFNEVDPVLHQCGLDFLHMVLEENSQSGKTIDSVVAGRQWEKIDVWAKIFYSDGTKVFLMIEDKVASLEHGNQLDRYQKTAQEKWGKEGFEIKCCYFKIVGESMFSLKTVMDRGYRVISRGDIRACLESYRDGSHHILLDFIDYLDALEYAHMQFENSIPFEWQPKTLAWVGLFQFIEKEMSIHTWHWVNNLSGGFWNLCLTWEYWNDCFPVYVQIEEKRICYKIALGERETVLDNSLTEINDVHKFVFQQLMAFAAERGVRYIVRPNRVAYNGDYRTLAVINQKDWCSDINLPLDKEEVVGNLNAIVDFYKDFMAHLNTISFQEAGIRVERKVVPLTVA